MIAHVTVTTENMQATIEFYQWLLDLPIDRRFPIGDEGGEIVFFGKPEETKFEVIYQPGNTVKPAEGVTVGFAVTSVKEKMDMLDHRNIPHSPLIAPNPHASFCMFTDLNGVKIQLFEAH
jgi:catechol 2,3-dioxygenase-like lactoylglutathione lyase family enzyme